MRRSFFLLAMMALASSGCIHSPPNYPGAGGDNLDPIKFAAMECPNLSGLFAGLGELVEGDASAKQSASRWRLSNVFPFHDADQAQAVLEASQSRDGRYLPPAFVQVQMRDRQISLDLRFDTGKSIQVSSSFEDKRRFVCTGPTGIVSWGGASGGGRSEFGPHRSDSVVTLYLDPAGNLIMERGMQVHMSLRLGHMPTGTAKYFAIYRFKRIQ
ncbi:hypothetical protein LMG23994_07110 [Cupriavidus pinatubonensis]|uniref:Lipoprotein n=1 Tax=Cupriavidus pinatubonensis TaxID=248026 RepID=A0ABM8Y4F4_9BURK|nr:hypothetical protein LMG23994_07110 [Cupriavidus pinatubonensis]